MPAPTEWGDVALSCTREQFCSVHRHPFLYSTQTLIKPPRPQQTMKREGREITQLVKLVDPAPPAAGSPIVYPILKVQSTFPSMITVGRTANNDVVIDDVQVSKFHAFFRLDGKSPTLSAEVGDAGSSNGTRLADQLLEPRGPTRLIQSGERLAFGPVEFIFLAPDRCWDRLVSDLDNWGD